LAEQERVAPPSITKVVSKLEIDGLVTRTHCPEDRRVYRVAVSPDGAALLDETRRRKTAWLTARISELDPERQRRLADALDVLDELTS
jgi:DNA-binding MarR family transcriptional regulator